MAIASGLAVAQPLALAGAAFAGSLSAAMAVFGFSLRRGRRHIATLLLAGIAFPYLVSSSDAQADNIRFLAYLYGEEARGEPLVREVGDHIARLQAVVGRHPSEQRPSGVILSGGQTVTVAGSGTTEDGVLQLAGGCNAAAEAGIVGNRDISLEALPHMHPDVVIVTEANPDRPSLLPRLRDHPVVGALPVFRDGRVFVVKSSLLSTLSQWNVIGAEQLNRALYPGALP